MSGALKSMRKLKELTFNAAWTGDNQENYDTL